MSLPAGVAYQTINGESRLATEGDPVDGEPTRGDWRAWDRSRSKLAAILDRGIETGLQGNDRVLYLGAAAGTTVSHLADFVGPVYAVEIAARPMRDLVAIAKHRPNVIPLLKDARNPESYAHVVESGLDIIVQDVATRNQAGVAIANRDFLKPDGHLVLTIKARSEDVTATPESVFDEALQALKDTYMLKATDRLDEFHADHLAVIATPR